MMAKKGLERVIGEFETRRIGNSLVLTVPKKAGVSESEKYVLVKKADGILEYRPVQQNPWLAGDYADIDFKTLNQTLGDGDNGSSIGKEHVEW